MREPARFPARQPIRFPARFPARSWRDRDPRQPDLFQTEEEDNERLFLSAGSATYQVNVDRGCKTDEETTKLVRRADRIARMRRAIERVGELVLKPRPVVRPPMVRLQAFARFFFSPRTYELVIEPRFSDAMLEYYDALQEAAIWKARWVRVRETIGVVILMAVQALGSVGKIAVKLWKIAAG